MLLGYCFVQCPNPDLNRVTMVGKRQQDPPPSSSWVEIGAPHSSWLCGAFSCAEIMFRLSLETRSGNSGPVGAADRQAAVGQSDRRGCMPATPRKIADGTRRQSFQAERYLVCSSAQRT